MAALPDVTPEYYQILVARELRKMGLELRDLRVRRRSELPEPHRGFVLELVANVQRGDRSGRLLIACYRQDEPVAADIVAAVPERAKAAQADVALVITTSDYAAPRSDILLLRVVDARAAYDASGWSAPGHYPAWLPAHVLQRLDGQPLDSRSLALPG